MARADGRRAGGDSGASALEVAIAFPVLLLATLLVVQFALVQHARHVALAVAQRAGEAARLYQAGDPAGVGVRRDRRDRGEQTGMRLARSLGGSVLDSPAVAVALPAAGDRVTVAVRGTVHGPLFALTVRQSVTGPVERFVGTAGP